MDVAFSFFNWKFPSLSSVRSFLVWIFVSFSRIWYCFSKVAIPYPILSYSRGSDSFLKQRTTPRARPPSSRVLFLEENVISGCWYLFFIESFINKSWHFGKACRKFANKTTLEFLQLLEVPRRRRGPRRLRAQRRQRDPRALPRPRRAASVKIKWKIKCLWKWN